MSPFYDINQSAANSGAEDGDAWEYFTCARLTLTICYLVFPKLKLFFRHNQQLDEVNGQHKEEIERLQEQLRRERQRCADDRAHYENEASQIRRIAQERASAEIERIREEEEVKRKVLMKKHAVNHPLQHSQSFLQ